MGELVQLPRRAEPAPEAEPLNDQAEHDVTGVFQVVGLDLDVDGRAKDAVGDRVVDLGPEDDEASVEESAEQLLVEQAAGGQGRARSAELLSRTGPHASWGAGSTWVTGGPTITNWEYLLMTARVF